MTTQATYPWENLPVSGTPARRAEAVRAATAFAAAELGPGGAVSHVDSRDAASRRVPEKSGAWLDAAALPNDVETLVYIHELPGSAA